MTLESDLLDYCGRSNSVILLFSSVCEQPNSNLMKAIIDSHFAWKMVDDLNKVLPGMDSFREIECYENFIVITPVCIPSDILESWLHFGILVFSTVESNNSFFLSEDVIVQHLRSWALYPYVQSPTHLPEPLRGVDGPTTFTGITMSKRIPHIIQQTAQSIPDLSPQGQTVYSLLADNIRENGQIPDYALRSSSSLLHLLFQVKVHRARRCGLGWHAISWWLAENYQYFCMNYLQQELLQHQPNLPRDPFFYLKRDALTTAMTVFPEMVSPILKQVRSEDHLTETIFAHSLLRNLWGNKADLSMSGGKVNQEEVKTDRTNSLLVNDFEAVWQYISTHSLKRVVICADNTGLELLCDLMLIAVLLHFYQELKVVYVIKAMPVFVSDVTLSDMEPTLQAMEQDKHPDVQWIAHTIRNAVVSNRLSYKPSTFLCTASPAWEMPLSMATLLANQDLMLGKGDANYRRLVGDLHWPYETPYEQVWNYYPCPLLLLRTLKSNVNIGVSKELQEMAAKSNSTWDCDGKLGIMQFYKPSHCK